MKRPNLDPEEIYCLSYFSKPPDGLEPKHIIKVKEYRHEDKGEQHEKPKSLMDG